MTHFWFEYDGCRLSFWVTSKGECRFSDAMVTRRNGTRLSLRHAKGRYTIGTIWEVGIPDETQRLLDLVSSPELKQALQRELDSWIKRLQKASKSLQADPLLEDQS